MSSTSLESYESDSDSFEQDSSHVEGTQYETDSASGRERSDDSYGDSDDEDEEDGDDDGDDDGHSRSFTESEDDDGWGTGSSRSRSNYDDEEGNSSFDDRGSQSDEEDDNSEFWDRYGKNDDDTEGRNGRPTRPTGKWTAPLARGSSDDDDEDDSSNDEFDDEYGLAFPSIAGTPSASSTPAKRKQRKTNGSGSLFPCTSSCLQNRQVMWIALAGLLVIVAAAVVVPLYVLKDDAQLGAAETDTPTTGSQTPSPSPSQTLSGPLIQIPFSLFGVITDGQENDVSTEVLEADLSQAFDLLAHEFLETISGGGSNATNETLTNATKANATFSVPNATNQSIQEAGNPKVGTRNSLEAISVQDPSSVDVTEIGKFPENSNGVIWYLACFSHGYLPIRLPKDTISRQWEYVRIDPRKYIAGNQ
jgi:hypothetical protein